MDRICIAVLEKICSLAGAGRYVVFSEDELTDAIPDGEDGSEKALKSALKSLQADGFIDLKYSSGNMFCIAPLKKYEPLPEPASEPPVLDEKPPKVRHKWGRSFWGAFFGGALGSLIISLIFALIRC